MKNATQYARKIKRLLTRLKQRYGTPRRSEPTDPVQQLLFGILHQGTSVAHAEKALARLRSAMVDLNELRVSTPTELADVLGSAFPHATEKGKSIAKALNNVFVQHHDLDMSSLKDKGKREARKYLEGLRGMDPSTAAGVVLFSLEGHAVPVDENMLTVLHKDGLAHPKADCAEVQGFLERHVSAANAQAVTKLLRRHTEDRIRSLGRTGRRAETDAKPSAKKKTRPAASKKTAPSKKRKSKAAKPRTESRAKARSTSGTSRTRKTASKKKTSPARSSSSRGAARKPGAKAKSRRKSR